MGKSINAFMVRAQGVQTNQAWIARAQLKKFIGKLKGYIPWLQLLLFLGSSLFPAISEVFSKVAWIVDVILDLLEFFANKKDFGGRSLPKSSQLYSLNLLLFSL